MTESKIPELAELQRNAGPGVCCLCLRELKPKPGGGRAPIICWSADCRAQEDMIRSRHKRSRAVADIGEIVNRIELLVDR